MEEINKKYLTKVCVHPTTYVEIPWRTDIPLMRELAEVEYHVTVLKDFKIEYATVAEGNVELDCGIVRFDELDGWLPGYNCTHQMRLSDNAPKDVRLWTHEFYQNDPVNRSYDFYRSQRPAVVVLQEERKLKKGLFLASVVSIEPVGQFKIQGVGGSCHHNYFIGEEFHLRQHKETFSSFTKRPYWFEVRFPGHDFAEDFRLISEEQ